MPHNLLNTVAVVFFVGLPTSFFALKITEHLLQAGISIEHHYVGVLHFMYQATTFPEFFSKDHAFFPQHLFYFIVPNR